MPEIAMQLPDESLQALHLTLERAADEVRLLAAVKYFELGKLSTGAAANLAGIPVVAFLHKLADLGVSPFNITAEEVSEDVMRAARRQ